MCFVHILLCERLLLGPVWGVGIAKLPMVYWQSLEERASLFLGVGLVAISGGAVVGCLGLAFGL